MLSIFGKYLLKKSEMTDLVGMFFANSAGDFDDKLHLAVYEQRTFYDRIQSLFDLLSNFPDRKESLSSGLLLELPSSEGAEELNQLFDHYGSDKGSFHEYSATYASIFHQLRNSPVILEIGLGTPDPSILSNMGTNAKPGASLMAIGHYLPSARIYGADVDRKILFNDSRISTFYIDQLNPKSFDEIARHISTGIDVLIDDGLHSPLANLNTIIGCLPLMNPHGWLVVEDISEASIPLWKMLYSLLLPKLECELILNGKGNLFLIHFPESLEQ
jgi:hypothetical protein